MKKQATLVLCALAGGALFTGYNSLRADGNDVQMLRAQGPQGLQKFLAAHKSEIENHTSKIRDAKLADDASWRLVGEQLDSIAGQHDAWSSRLYWFTDLQTAKAASKAQSKPILSLRMLGKLSDEYSCANSRFFRAALYANKQISQNLRDNYILHWSSERPAPVVTIDMGDGRILKRTLTGNSAHYLLDAEGRPLDVLPGLYGPGAFEEWLQKGRALFNECNGLEGAARGEKLKAWHEAELVALADKYMAEVKAGNPDYWRKAEQKVFDQTRANALKTLKNTATLAGTAPRVVEASRAGAAAVTKTLKLEATVLDATALYRGVGFSRYEFLYWGGLAPHLEKARLDENSRLLLRSQNPVLDKASVPSAPLQNVQFGIGRGTPQAPPPADPFERLVDSFERNIAVDSARNEWNFHAPLHQWFATHEVGDFDALNRMVYDKLFLTPQSDAWLGLSPAGTYTGLDDSGLFEAPKSGQRQAMAK